jgi:hypothetical protein
MRLSGHDDRSFENGPGNALRRQLQQRTFAN